MKKIMEDDEHNVYVPSHENFPVSSDAGIL